MAELLKYLPSLYQTLKGTQADFLEAMLQTFEEQYLQGKEKQWGIRQILENLEEYFVPHKTPAEMVPWLAGWFGLQGWRGLRFESPDDLWERRNHREQALPLRDERDSFNRRLIKDLAPKLHLRGTRAGLETVILSLLGDEIRPEGIHINELEQPMRIGRYSKIGESTLVGEGAPYLFHVTVELEGVIRFPDPLCENPEHATMREIQLSAHASEALRKKREINRLIVSTKPAHTHHNLWVKLKPMRVGKNAVIGLNCLAGGMTI